MQTICLLRKPFWEGNLSLFALHLYTLLVGALLCFWTPIQCLLQNQWSSWLKENQLSAFLNLYSLISRLRSFLLFLRILHEAQFTYKLWTPGSVLLFNWYLEYQIWRYSSKGIAKKNIRSIHCVLNSQVLPFPCFWSTVEAQWSTPIRKVTSQRKDWTHCVNDMITDQVLYALVSSFICWEKLEFLLCQTAMGINQVHILKLSWHCSLLCLLRFN